MISNNFLCCCTDCQRQSRPKGTSKATTPFKAPAQAKDDELTDECPEPNGYFADGFQCDKYYECIEGAITEKLCPDGMVFNDYNIQVEKCDLPFNIDCSTRSELRKSLLFLIREQRSGHRTGPSQREFTSSMFSGL